jgi:hypothetical protein
MRRRQDRQRYTFLRKGSIILPAVEFVYAGAGAAVAVMGWAGFRSAEARDLRRDFLSFQPFVRFAGWFRGSRTPLRLWNALVPAVAAVSPEHFTIRVKHSGNPKTLSGSSAAGRKP